MVWGKAAGSGVDDLVKRLQANDPQLKSLTILRFRRLNDEALSALVSAGLPQNKSVLVWDLEHKGLSQASGASVARVLQQHPVLQQLQLSRNSLTDAGLQQLCAVPWNCLTQLELAGCDLTHQGVLSLAAAPSIGQLQQLDLSHNDLGPAAAPGLAELLAKATSLQHLKLKSTQLQDDGVIGTAEGLLSASAGLRLLDLSSNQLNSTGLAALAAALARHPAGAAAVQHLVLAENPGVDDEAVCRLAESLAGHAAAAAGADGDTQQQQQQQQQQVVLDLAHAGVGAGGIAALSKVAALQQLSLFGCKLGGEPDIETLELGANPGVQEEGFEELVGQLRAGRPGLDVHWRVADSDGAPPGAGQQ
ncbi:hypothetical protein OEZ85_004400 [Tetradesmus obliquus]|uniref:RNI-like protein n=1 Tax=Tetradesmus obliquus TaxID=3088 RepID=A0ABY8ULR1_TETOB|nr:hypothetical protein OEZ85_004400 [Tetradesmus obliquus]